MARKKITMRTKTVTEVAGLGRRTRGGRTVGRQGVEGLVQAIISGIAPTVAETITKETFPAMEKDMQAFILGWQEQGMVHKDSNGVYNNFKYTKNARIRGKTTTVKFENNAIHAPALIDGVTPRNKPWFIGNWLSEMGTKLRNKNTLQRSDGTYPRFIVGIGETVRRGNPTYANKSRITKNKLDKLTSSKTRYKGKTKDIHRLTKLKKKYDLLDNKANRKSYYTKKDLKGNVIKKTLIAKGSRKFSALVKGQSRRNFWTPVVSNYLGSSGRDTSSSSSISNRKTTNERIMIKQISGKLYENIKNVKTKK